MEKQELRTRMLITLKYEYVNGTPYPTPDFLRQGNHCRAGLLMRPFLRSIFQSSWSSKSELRIILCQTDIISSPRVHPPARKQSFRTTCGPRTRMRCHRDPRQVRSPCRGDPGEVPDLDSLRPGSAASEGTHRTVAS